MKQFQFKETCICITAELHDVSAAIGYHDYQDTEEIFRADLATYEALMNRDGSMIDTLIETLQEDREYNTDDEELKSDIAELIEELKELKNS